MELGRLILQELQEVDGLRSNILAKKLNVDHQAVVGAIKSLENLDLVSCEQICEVSVGLTSEGIEITQNGSHEFRVYSAVPDDGISQVKMMNQFPDAKIGISKALSSKWITLRKENNDSVLYRLNTDVTDCVRELLLSIQSSGGHDITDNEKSMLKKRKLITEIKQTIFLVTKGSSFTLDIQKEETDLTADLISSGRWKDAKFKPLNLNALGAAIPSGHLHPLLCVRSEFCKILTDMGFMEMPTNNYVECGFWNFDSLFQPQQHPARDAQDTFFLSDPAKTDITKSVPSSYIDRVRTVHSVGAFGSRGYQSEWRLDEAEKNLLRTHTTAVSARMLYLLANQDPVTPVRYFSIDRVFRNETLDATHLAEFHQVEGLIADYGLSLGHLKGIIRTFFDKLGLRNLRFKPAYNPYTEPSMEIFSYHPGLKKWVEIGNSGIFRPEMLRPMGLPDGLTVIAWGLSLERPTMILYGYKNIRDLIGPKIDLNMIYNAPLCRLDKFT